MPNIKSKYQYTKRKWDCAEEPKIIDILNCISNTKEHCCCLCFTVIPSHQNILTLNLYQTNFLLFLIEDKTIQSI